MSTKDHLKITTRGDYFAREPEVEGWTLFFVARNAETGKIVWTFRPDDAA